MGYLKKGGTVCNPAKKKNTVVFQNSFQETYQTGTEQYQTGTTTIYLKDVATQTQTGRYEYTLTNRTSKDYTFWWGGQSWTLPANGSVRNGQSFNMNSISVGTEPTYSTRPTYGTRTMWNTKWRKLSA